MKDTQIKKEILLPRECKLQIAEYMAGHSDNLDISPYNMGGLLLELYYKKTIQSNWGRYSIMKGTYIPLKANCQYSTMKELMRSFADPVVMLFLGGLVETTDMT